MVHSDRGCHYRWPDWIRIMDTAELTRSMSKKDALRIILPVKASLVDSKMSLGGMSPLEV